MRLKKPRLRPGLALGRPHAGSRSCPGLVALSPAVPGRGGRQGAAASGAGHAAAEATGRDRDELATAKGQLETAEQDFRSCQIALRHDPLVRLAEHVPWLGRQTSAAEDVLAMGRDASDIGLAGVAVAEEYSAVRGRAAREHEREDDDASRQGEAAHAAGQRRARRACSPTVSRSTAAASCRRCGSARRQVDEHTRRDRGPGQDVRPGGASSSPTSSASTGPRTYLVLAQNNAELLPTGGLISVYGVVTLKDGHVEEMSFADAIAFNENWQTDVARVRGAAGAPEELPAQGLELGPGPGQLVAGLPDGGAPGAGLLSRRAAASRSTASSAST